MRIVGAGAAGLSLALMVPGSEIVEAESLPGGLCRSTTVDGFTFDQGPHILGGIPDAVDWIVESTGIDYVEGVTNNRGWRDGEWCPHPFEDERAGRAYMAKMWKADPAKLSLPGLRAQAGRKPGGVRTFRYPARGGYQAITDAWASKLDVTYNERATDGDVWTAPLEGARYNALALVTAGYEGPAPDLTAVYLPDGWTPFHRLSFPSRFSPENAPRGCYSIQAEMSIAPWGIVPPGLVGSFDHTVATLGFEGEQVFVVISLVEYAYPVPVGSPVKVGHGRTGGHAYLNVDGVVAASMELAKVLA